MDNGEPKPQRTPRVVGATRNQQNKQNPSLIKQAEEIVARRRARNKRKAAKRKARKAHLKGLTNTSALGGAVAAVARGPFDGSSLQHLPPPARIALGIAVPGVVPLSRMVSEYADSPTAIANPFTRIPAGWSTDTDILPCFIFRNCERSIVLYEANAGSEPWAYGFYGTDKTTQTPAATWTQAISTDTKSYLHTPYALSLEDFEPHGDMMFAGATSDEHAGRYFWFNSTDTLDLTITLPVVSGVTYSFALEMDFWSPRTGVLDQVVHPFVQNGQPGGVYAMTSAVCSTLTGWQGSGYYCFNFTLEVFASGVKDFSTEQNVTFSNFKISSTGVCIGHRACPDYFTNVGAVSGVRVSAGCVRYTNTAALNDLQGQVTVYQCPQTKHWQDFFTYTNLTGSKGAETFDVRAGSYHFIKPTQPTDFSFQSYTFVENGVLCDSFYPLKETSGFLACVPRIEDQQGRSGFFQINYGLEYQTTDVWRDVALPTDTLANWDKAMAIVRDLDQYYENPTHLKEILKQISSGGRKVLKWGVEKGPQVLNLLSTLSGLVA